MKNIEYKAELRDPELARAIARQIGAYEVVRVRQTDTYYKVTTGRVKKREAVAIDRAVATPEPVEYIVYDRPDRVETRISDFSVLTEQEMRARFGQADLPVWLTVSKTRELWMWKSVRIHLDQVEDLGWFFELESLVARADLEEEAARHAEHLRATFLPALGEGVSTSYSDLLDQHRTIDPNGDG
ncbi:MAG: class IV adenylate cyclase [Planctomycetota bacterium]